MEIEIIEQNNEFVIDSRIIASRFDINHKSFCETIQKHFSRLKRQKSSGTNGRPAAFYYLNKRQVMLLPALCRSSPELIKWQSVIIDKFEEMEKIISGKNIIPSDPVEQALILAKALMEKDRENQGLKNAITAKNSYIEKIEPKAAHYSEFINSAGKLSLNDMAKIIGNKTGKVCGQNKLSSFLREKKILYYNNEGRLIPYQRYIDNKWCEVYQTKYNINGDDKLSLVTKYTANGVNKIAEMWKNSGNHNQ